ncbi:hypothetical protein BDV19DRAFT_363653 [Aspergillus venezuelensis]
MLDCLSRSYPRKLLNFRACSLRSVTHHRASSCTLYLLAFTLSCQYFLTDASRASPTNGLFSEPSDIPMHFRGTRHHEVYSQHWHCAQYPQNRYKKRPPRRIVLNMILATHIFNFSGICSCRANMAGWSRTLVPASIMTTSDGAFVLRYYALPQRVRIIETLVGWPSVLNEEDTKTVKMAEERLKIKLGVFGFALMDHVIKFLEFMFGTEEDDAFETYTSNLRRDSDALMVGALP